MKIALFGYGKMGKLIEEIAHRKGHEIVAIIKKHEDHPSLNAADVCIDFSSPHATIQNIKKAAASHKPMVIGTTGWMDQLPQVTEIVRNAGIGVVYAANFSIGAHLFYKLVANAGALIDKFDDYEVGGFELHHSAKTDSPSGTAKALGDILLKNMSRKSKVQWEPLNRSVEENEIHFTSLRCGKAPGTHSIIFDSPVDTITLTHEARNREGFASGAITAAQWVLNRTGLFTIDDLL